MKDSTKNYYKKAIRIAKEARETIEKVEERYQRELEAAKSDYNAGITGEIGYTEIINKLQAERDAKIEAAVADIKSVSKTVRENAAARASLNSNRISTDVLNILNSGLKLSANDMQELADRYKDNWVTTRLLKQYWETRREEIETANKKIDGIYTSDNEPESTDVIFKSDPTLEADAFDSFTNTLYYSAKSGTVLQDYADRTSYWKIHNMICIE